MKNQINFTNPTHPPRGEPEMGAKLRKRLYNHCYRAKRKGYRINARKRTIYIPCTNPELINWVTVQNLNKEYGFVFQTEII